MEIPLLQDIVVISFLALVVVYFCSKAGIPPIVGLLLTGVFAGPHGLKLIKEVSAVEHLAEIGVVCLLFTIGLEFSLGNLIKIKRLVLLGGLLQVGITSGFTILLGVMTGMPLNEAIFFSFLLALSSTAIVLRLFQERGESETPHGRNGLGILIFQDLAVVPMMLMLPGTCRWWSKHFIFITCTFGKGNRHYYTRYCRNEVGYSAYLVPCCRFWQARALYPWSRFAGS